jgi:hypothetical protein
MPTYGSRNPFCRSDASICGHISGTSLRTASKRSCAAAWSPLPDHRDEGEQEALSAPQPREPRKEAEEAHREAVRVEAEARFKGTRLPRGGL